MQKTLPLNSDTLQGLSAIDPAARGHSVTAKHLKMLCDKLDHVITEDSDIALEIKKYNVDNSLPPHDTDFVQWWAQVISSKKYPGLAYMWWQLLSIFHGPQIEASFSYMTDILDSKAGKMKVETFSSIQTVKYTLKTKKQKCHSVIEKIWCKILTSWQ